MAALQVSIDKAAGVAVLTKAAWLARVPLADLPRWAAFYRRLWARKPVTNSARADETPGPWAGFYADDLRALERALKEMTP